MVQTPRVEYWRWEESTFVDPDIDLRNVASITAGVDVGSISSQAVIMADGELYAYGTIRTGSDSPESARNTMNRVLEAAGMKLEDINFVVGTGYGRVNVPFADKTVTEIACHARGANYMGGSTIRTILDMGGQDCKAIQCDENGKVVEFLMNDKCAAGTGRGMEVIADLLSVPITELGAMSLCVDKEPPPISSICVVFARTAAIGLMREGWSKNDVLAAYCGAMAHRVVGLLKRIGVQEEFTITGGISKNVGVVKRILDELQLDMVTLKPDPQIAGGLGAAIFARSFLEKRRRVSGGAS